MLAVRAAWQIGDAVLLERFVEQQAAMLEAERAKAPAASLAGFLQRRELRSCTG